MGGGRVDLSASHPSPPPRLRLWNSEPQWVEIRIPLVPFDEDGDDSSAARLPLQPVGEHEGVMSPRAFSAPGACQLPPAPAPAACAVSPPPPPAPAVLRGAEPDTLVLMYLEYEAAGHGGPVCSIIPGGSPSVSLSGVHAQEAGEGAAAVDRACVPAKP